MQEVRRAIGGAIFERIAGPQGAAVRSRLRVAGEGERWFPADSPIARVHGDASMFIGGLSALLLQSLHPLAMAGVDEHSGFRGDPWGRLARTSRFLAVTTYGTSEDARRQIAAVRAVHRRVVGIAPDGRPYAASDPHLLSWVHVCEVDAFLRSFQRYGSSPLTPEEADEYVAQTGRVAIELGAVDVPMTVADVAAMLAAYRPELRWHARRPRDGALPRRDAAAAAGPAPGVPADRRGRRRPAPAMGPLAAAPAVAAADRGDARPGQRRRGHAASSAGPCRPPRD